MQHQQPFTSFVFPSEQTPALINSDFTFNCHLPVSVPVSSITFALPLCMNPTLSLNTYSIDNSQPSQVSHLNSPTTDNLVPEFFQYSKEKYENEKSNCRRVRRPRKPVDGNDVTTMSPVEFRRQMHIQSEQKRRAKIKDGFEELCRQLPTSYTRHKLSKTNLLQKAVSHMKNIQRKESFLLDEIKRLTQTCIYLNAELEKEKRIGTLYRQKQTLDKKFKSAISP